jgi:hypothetical protein
MFNKVFVQDRHDLCRQWRNNDACALDRHFSVSETDPYNGQVQRLFNLKKHYCPSPLHTCFVHQSIQWTGHDYTIGKNTS